ncbi:hypothetical protein [Candidatus Harpocratesius sp.]
MGYNEEKKNLEKMGQYLDNLGIPFKHQDIGDKSEDKFPTLICTYRFEEKHNFDVIIYSVEEWIHVKCLVLKVNRLKPKLRCKLYEMCLQLNYDLPEVTFSANKGDIYIEIDALAEISFEDFTAEFQSISQGISIFIENIQNQYDIDILDTNGEEHTGIYRKKRIFHNVYKK